MNDASAAAANANANVDANDARGPTTRRYEPLLKIASGGTASVWVGAAAGALGFRQLVAIKRPHEHLADDPAFVAALVEEAKIASRLRHANAVDVRDVESDENGVQLVMDWVEGASVSDLIRAWQKEPPARTHAVAIRIVLDACEGLRALHELAGDDGAPLGCVHRDVSPANVLVGLDGVGRITDFGLARPLLAVERTTSQGALRGKLGYMAPEYIRGKEIDHKVDVFAMAIVLWEAVACKRLFRGENDAETLDRVQREDPPKLAVVVPALGPIAGELDALLERALAKDPAARIASMADLSKELERIARAHDAVATHTEVRDAFGPTLRASLEERRREVQRALARTGGDAAASGSFSASTGPRSRPPPSLSLAVATTEGGKSAPPPAFADAGGLDNTGTRPGTPDALRFVAQGDAPHNPAVLVATNNKPRTLRLVLALVVAAIVLVSGAVAIALAMGMSKKAMASSSPRAIEPDIQQRADELRGRSAPAPSSSASSPSSKATASAATHVHGPRSATTAAAGTKSSSSESSEPGNKAPRPNPYASGTRP